MRAPERSGPEDIPGSDFSLLALAIISLLVGGVAGTVCGIFRLLIDEANDWRNDLLAWMHDWKLAGLMCVVVIFASAVVVAVWLVRRFSPYAAGSGIPHVEAVLSGDLPPASAQLILVKFVGGFLALGSGLALGREGPSVQMGASVGHLLGTAFKCNTRDRRLLLAAGAGAGLAVAFNAPIAGAAFVLEELMRRFDTRCTIVTFGASASAIAVGRMMFGSMPDFQVMTLPYAGFGCLPVGLMLGILAGFLGIAYNWAVLGALNTANRLQCWPAEARAAVVGAAVGLLGWFGPDLIGGGDGLTQSALIGGEGGGLLIAIFLLRFGLGPVSYAVGTPGGLFAPMLVLGSQSGLLFGNFCHHWFPSVVSQPVAYAVIGIAAFFTAVVRAPLTGIILAIELTGSYTQMLPMLAACFAAMLVPTLLNNKPIYDPMRYKPFASTSVTDLS